MSCVKEKIGCCELILGDCNDVPAEELRAYEMAVLDPPYTEWERFNLQVPNKSKLAFTNYQNRRACEDAIAEKVRCEMIWHFEDGRWVSNALPRITHASILVYGETGSADVGPKQSIKPQKKGASSIGTWTQENRVYEPKERKHLNSVISIPRNTRNVAGGFGKPLALMQTLLMWIDPESVVDPFMGGASTGEACLLAGKKYLGIEKDPEIYEKACDRLYNAEKQRSLF